MAGQGHAVLRVSGGSSSSARRVRRATAAALAAALLVAFPATADEIDIDYAEHQPLAAQSLLLDVIDAGDRWVAVGERGHVLWSEDGVEWTQAETVPTRSTLTTVSVAGDRLWAAGHDSVILTSGDNGRTWTRRYYAPERFQPIMDIRFFDARRGLAIGAYGLALLTRDGGSTCDEVVISEDEWHLNALLDLGGGRLMIAATAPAPSRPPGWPAATTWPPSRPPARGAT